MKVPWPGFEYYSVERKMQSRLLIKQTEADLHEGIAPVHSNIFN